MLQRLGVDPGTPFFRGETVQAAHRARKSALRLLAACLEGITSRAPLVMRSHGWACAPGAPLRTLFHLFHDPLENGGGRLCPGHDDQFVGDNPAIHPLSWQRLNVWYTGFSSSVLFSRA